MKSILKRTVFAVVVIALVAFAAGCGSKKSSESPETAMKNALQKTSTITSGQAAVKGSLALGSLPGSLTITGGGPFDTKASGGPAVQLDLSVDIAGSPQKFGFVTVDGKSYLTVDDKALEQKSSGGGLEPGQIADFIKGLGKYVTGVKSTADNTYTATVDVKKMIADNKNKAGSTLGSLSIPGLGSVDKLQNSLGNADVTVKVDSQGYAQTMDINLPITQGTSQGGVRATISLSEINQPQTIEKPKNVVSSASDLGGLGAALAGQ